MKVIAHIRELWVRNVYLKGDFISLANASVVVDLGANRGYFTSMAAAMAPSAKLIALEASRVGCESIRTLVVLNRWQDRLQVCNVFIGGMTERQSDKSIVPDADGVPHLSEDEFIDRYHLDRIDFLKCDIEGSEFGLFLPGSRLLSATRQLAIEIHDFAGNRGTFVQMLRDSGFEVREVRSMPGDVIVHARRPN